MHSSASWGMDGVFGGIFVDNGCRIVKEETPVSGLYAAGDLTSGNYIKENSHRTEVINDFTWALASGFLASSSMDEDFEAQIILRRGGYALYQYNRKGPKRGVALYSYSAEFGFSKDLEECFADIQDMGADGIEILANTHLK